MFDLYFYAFNEADGTTEFVKEGTFDSLEDAEDRIENIGSRWIFYPNARIIDCETGEEIKDFPAIY